MSSGSGVRLASGYIQLSVKTDGAMKELSAEITGIGKAADKAGREAGQALNDGISKGAKGAGRSVGDELTRSARQAGEAAGDALSDGITKGAKKTKVTLPQVDTKPARDSIIKDIGGSILDAARQGAKDAGTTLEAEFGKAAAKAGRAIGKEIGDSPLGDWVRGIGIDGEQAVGVLDSITKAAAGIKQHDLPGTLKGISIGLEAVGQGNSGFNGLLNQVLPVAEQFSDLQTTILGAGKGLQSFADGAPGAGAKISRLGSNIAEFAAPLAAAAAAIGIVVDGLGKIAAAPDPTKGFQSPIQGHSGSPVIPLPGSRPAVEVPGDAPAGTRYVATPGDTSNPFSGLLPPGVRAPGDLTPPALPSSGVVPNLVAPQPGGDAKGYLPRRAKGGVTPAGRIYGPGTGTSDSIIGIGADGLPTARVSTGEGVVNLGAMQRGGDKLVALLNAGWDPKSLPGFDDGTGPGGVPIPPNPLIAAALQRGFNPAAALPGGPGEGGLQNDSVRTRRIIQQLFPQVTDIGGYRPPDGFNEHSSGQALDVMIPGWNTPQGKALGDQISGFALSNGLADYSIWQHGQHNPDGSFQQYADRGSPTQNHLDHVHLHTLGGGYPGKDQQFFLPPQLQALFAGGGGAGAPDFGASITGVPGDPASPVAAGAPGGKADRTQGYIPAGAGASGQAGTSFASGLLQQGASAINGLIEQAGSAAATAISAAATAGSFGAGGQAAGPAAAFAIGIGTKAAERGVSYGFQMAGIGADALAEILSPFGVPRFFNTDPTQFMPQLPGQSAATTTGEKAKQAQDNPAAAAQPGQQPGGPVQPGQLPGQQPVAAPVKMAEAQGITQTAPSVGSWIGGAGNPGAPAAGGWMGGAAAPAVPAPAPQQPPVAPAPAPQQPPLNPLAPLDLPGFARGGIVPGVFDTGGWLQPNGIAVNRSNRPEPILNGQQMDNLQAIASQGMPTPDPKANGGGGADYSMHFGEGSIVVKDVEELQRELDSRQRLQRWRYAGRP
jgi:hypothetical protein